MPEGFWNQMLVAWTGLYAWGARLGYAHPNVRPLVEKVACDEPGILRFSARLWKRLPEFRGVL